MEKVVNSAHAVIVTPEGEYLVLTSSEWRERPDRSLKPDLPGGWVDPGESPISAVVREINEETSLIVAPQDCVLVHTKTDWIDEFQHSLNRHIFLVTAIKNEVELSWEHSEYHWVDRETFLATQWRPSQSAAIVYLAHHRLLPAE